MMSTYWSLHISPPQKENCNIKIEGDIYAIIPEFIWGIKFIFIAAVHTQRNECILAATSFDKVN